MISRIPAQAEYADGDTRPADDDGVIVETGKDTRTPYQIDQDAKRLEVANLLSLAQERFRVVDEAETVVRTEMREDRRFRLGEQWPLEIKALRATAGKPCLTINRIPQFLRQVVNTARANKPAIQVNAVDNGADPDTAKVLQGLCRNIEIKSHASVAYETATEHQAEMGRGFIRVITEYDDDEGFQQRIRIKRVRNPFSIYMDPNAQEVDGSDAEWAFVTEDMPLSQFTRKYPKANHVGLANFQSTGDQAIRWVTDKAVRVAEYWYAEYTDYEIAQIRMDAFRDPETGEVGPKVLTVPRSALLASRKQYRTDEGLPETEDADEIEATDIPGVTILQKRTVQRRKIKTCVINAIEILEGNKDKTGGSDWTGKRIPIVPVYGDEVESEGRVDYRGMVRDGRDPQRMYNYWVSSATEAIALAPRAPWIGVAGQFKNFETKWATAHTSNHAYLEYQKVDYGGKPAPAPKRSVEEPAIQAIMIALRQADLDLKAVMGLFDPSLGQAGPEESGKAILARQRQGEVANSNYADNLARAIQAVGEIIIDIAPKVYAVATVLRITGDDKKTHPVMLHAGQPPVLPKNVPDLKELAKLRKLQGIYDIGVGRYDVTVSVGPSYESQRQETVETMGQVLSRSPELMQLIGDLFFESMDWPMADVIGRRLKRAVPPHLLDPEDGEEEVPPAARQKMAEMEGKLKELEQVLQQFQMERAAKAQELAAKGQVAQFEAEARARTASETAAAQVRIAEIEAASARQKVELQAMADRQLAVLKSQLDGMLITLEAKMDEKLEIVKARLAPEPTEAAA